MHNGFHPGDPVIFRVTKRSSAPGPHATNIEPETLGEGYSYNVDKYWVFSHVQGDGKLVVRTRRGKTHVIEPDNPNLRRPNMFERLILRGRFPKLDELPPIEQPKPRT